MKLVIIGGAGFRVPQVVGAVATAGPVDTVALVDTDAGRLRTMRAVLEQLPLGGDLLLSTHTDLAEALVGADFVFCAIRVGGTAGRVADERVALDLGVLGQETTGPGGLAYALRTIPAMRAIARTVRRVAPQAWFVNFTNPAGIITEALRPVLGERVVGICDTPIGLMRRAAAAVGASGDSPDVRYDYVGLNHLGWLRTLEVDGVDRLPDLLSSPDRLERIEEARLIGPDWVRQLGALPNEYLFYYYCNREAVARILAAPGTRGEFLAAQQDRFYAEAAGRPGDALELWRETRRQREETYMAEARAEDEQRDAEDTDGGYQAVALALMTALSGGEPTAAIVNVAGRGAVPGLPDDAVVEVPCDVDADGIHPRPVAPLAGPELGLVQSVKAVEQLTIRAATEHSEGLAWEAFATHPLVGSVSLGRRLLDGYRARIPEVAAALSGDAG
ncbi:MAG: 6-phospho-beta-glucosidase [Propionicimonas sp.]|uniref:6-phospho-beta-glucosidase n=1 Tax=Propionicimonas sp. TaxID=1955623 RepID=UPI003D136028